MQRSLSVLALLAATFVSTGNSVVSAQVINLLPESEIKNIIGMLPDVSEGVPFLSDPTLEEIIVDPETIWYDQDSMPRVYQAGNGNKAASPPMRFADPFLNIAKGIRGEGDKPDGLGGNFGMDPPVAPQPGGTMRTHNIRDVKFFRLPERLDGTQWPIVYFPYYYDRMYVDPQSPRGNRRILGLWGWGWVFPNGTVFGEVLIQRYQGVDYVFEIRIRHQTATGFESDVLRPFNNRKEIVEALRERDEQDPLIEVLLAGHKEHYPELGFKMTFEGLEDNTRADDLVVIDAKAEVDYLPEFPVETTKALLLTVPFKSSLHETWNPGNERNPLALVPAGYDGAFAGHDFQTCDKCHDTAGTTSCFWDGLRAWKGTGAGFNRVLSAHPIDPASYKGSLRGRDLANHPGRDTFRPTGRQNGAENVIYIRPVFKEAGIVERYNKAKHPDGMYNTFPIPDFTK